MAEVSLSLSEAGQALRSGEASSVQLTKESLSAAESLDGELGAFVIIDREGALEAAARADEALAAGEDSGPLTGIPIAIKDIIDIAGQPTRCGSPAYPTAPVGRDATVIRRLKLAGAVIVGKTTAHELACGVYSAPASNPWATDRIPGGSSGGSGAAVAAGIVTMAIGSDTGGSIRIPAALCGVVGLKPTYGRVPRVGVEPLSWSLDHLGPLASTVAGCAATLEAIAGADTDDPTTVSRPALDLTDKVDRGVEGLRLGVLTGEPIEPMQPDVADTFASATERLEQEGASLVRVTIPELAYTIAAEFGIVGPESAAYHQELLHSQPDRIDPDIRNLLVAGLMLPADQYIKALRARRVISDAIRRAFISTELDALLSPTLPATAATKDQEEIDYGSHAEPVTISYVRTTAPFNLSGLPALSVPAGFDRDGLPIGLQIAAAPYDEAMLVTVGTQFETFGAAAGRRPAIHAERSAA